MAKNSALTLSKVQDTYQIEHRGYPKGGLIRFHVFLGLSAVLVIVLGRVEVGSVFLQVSYLAAAVMLLYAASGYLLYSPFAALGGRLSFRPKDENMVFSKRVLGKDVETGREIPWEGKLEIEIEQVGWKVRFLPLSFYRVKVVTDFMTYHVATFGPGLSSTAEDLAKAIRKARFGGGRSRAVDFDALTGNSRSAAQTATGP